MKRTSKDFTVLTCLAVFWMAFLFLASSLTVVLCLAVLQECGLIFIEWTCINVAPLCHTVYVLFACKYIWRCESCGGWEGLECSYLFVYNGAQKPYWIKLLLKKIAIFIVFGLKSVVLKSYKNFRRTFQMALIKYIFDYILIFFFYIT